MEYLNSFKFCGREFFVGSTIIREITSSTSMNQIYNGSHYKFFLNKFARNYEESVKMFANVVGRYVNLKIDNIISIENVDERCRPIVNVYGTVVGEPFEIPLMYKSGDSVCLRVSYGKKGKCLSPISFNEHKQVYFFNLGKDQYQGHLLANAIDDTEWEFKVIDIFVQEVVNDCLFINVVGYFPTGEMKITKKYEAVFSDHGTIIREESWSGGRFIDSRCPKNSFIESVVERSWDCSTVFRTTTIYSDATKRFVLGVQVSELTPEEYARRAFQRTGIMPSLRRLPVRQNQVA